MYSYYPASSMGGWVGGCSIIVMGALIAAEAFIVVVAPFVYNNNNDNTCNT